MKTINKLAPCTLQTRSEFQSQIDNIREVYLLDQPPRFTPERRQAERFSVTIPVVIRPLNDDMEPMTYTQIGMTRDVSYTGISVVSSNPQANRMVRLSVEPAHLNPIEIVGIVKYCSDFGWYYRLGIEFVFSDAKLPIRQARSV